MLEVNGPKLLDLLAKKKMEGWGHIDLDNLIFLAVDNRLKQHASKILKDESRKIYLDELPESRNEFHRK